MSQAPFQLILIGSRHLRQLKGEGMTKGMGTQRRNAACRIAHLGIMPASNLQQDQIDSPWGETAIHRPGCYAGRAQKERGHLWTAVPWTFLLQIFYQGCSRICREKDRSLCFPLAFHMRNFALSCGSQG